MRPAELEDFLDNLPLLVDFDGIDAEVAAVVLMLRDRRLKRTVNIGEPLAKNVPEANQNRQADAAQLQMIDKLLEIDRPFGIFGDVNAEMTVGTD